MSAGGDEGGGGNVEAVNAFVALPWAELARLHRPSRTEPGTNKPILRNSVLLTLHKTCHAISREVEPSVRLLTCPQCQRQVPRLFNCARCCREQFCSRACSRKQWWWHKHVCGPEAPAWPQDTPMFLLPTPIAAIEDVD